MYFDNAATSLVKPKSFIKAFESIYSSCHYGSFNRSGHSLSVNSLLGIIETKKSIAGLFNVDITDIAFCNNYSFGFNILIRSLLSEHDHVITFDSEHNATLRPLYSFCRDLTVLESDFTFDVNLLSVKKALKKNTKFLIMSHADNLSGCLRDIEKVANFCKKHNLIFICDISQTAGILEIDLKHFENAFFITTGHKSLLGDANCGFVIKRGEFTFQDVFQSGSGIDSFSKKHPNDFENIFLVGTYNYVSLLAFKHSVDFLNEVGVSNIRKKLLDLTETFYDGVRRIEGVNLYFDFDEKHFTPIVCLNIEGVYSDLLQEILDGRYNIQTRAGFHCAPLIHKKIGTQTAGLCRFSFSYFNEKEEVEYAIKAIEEISKLR